MSEREPRLPIGDQVTSSRIYIDGLATAFDYDERTIRRLWVTLGYLRVEWLTSKEAKIEVFPAGGE